MSKRFTIVRQASFMLSLGVSIVLLQATLAQSYLFALSEQPPNFIDIDRWLNKWNITLPPQPQPQPQLQSHTQSPLQTHVNTIANGEFGSSDNWNKYKDNNKDLSEEEDEEDHDTFRNVFDSNSTLFIYDNSITGKRRTDLSQTTMDIVTIVWYVATFLALVAFFLLMACSDRRCHDSSSRRNAQTQANGNDTNVPPPLTPTPSYSEFAPPTYEAVMKMKEDARSSGVYVVPLPMENGTTDGYKSDDTNSNIIANNNNNNNDELRSVVVVIDGSALPVADFYTIDEVHKNES